MVDLNIVSSLERDHHVSYHECPGICEVEALITAFAYHSSLGATQNRLCKFPNCESKDTEGVSWIAIQEFALVCEPICIDQFSVAMVHIVTPVTFVVATVAELNKPVAVPSIILELASVLVSIGIPFCTISMSLVILPLSVIIGLSCMTCLHSVIKSALPVLLIIVELAFIDVPILASELATAVLLALKPRAFIGLPIIVRIPPRTREFSIGELAFVSCVFAHNILAVTMMLISEPAANVKATIVVVHLTFALHHVIFVRASVDISVCKGFFSLAAALPIQDSANINLAFFSFDSA